MQNAVRPMQAKVFGYYNRYNFYGQWNETVKAFTCYNTKDEKNEMKTENWKSWDKVVTAKWQQIGAVSLNASTLIWIQ